MDRVPTGRLLVVSHDPNTIAALHEIAVRNVWSLEQVVSGWDALEQVSSDYSLDLVILDLASDEAGGLHSLRWLRRIRPNLPTLVLAGVANGTLKSEALRMGAHDYLSRPLNLVHLQSTLERNLRPLESAHGIAPPQGSAEVEHLDDDTFFISATPAMQKLRVQAELLAQIDTPMLFVGERGSGREITARLIHKVSARAGFRFSRVDCSTATQDSLERDLFGTDPTHTKDGRAKGRLEACDQGVLFIDDVAEMSAHLQARLLEVLRTKSFLLPQDGQRVRADVRIAAATGPHVEQAVSQGRFRRDLYYQLSAFTVCVPPLRQRQEEVPLLLGLFMSQLAKQYRLPSRPFSPALLEACEAHVWPGNIRELRAFAKRYLVVGDEELAVWELKKSAAAHRTSLTSDCLPDISESTGAIATDASPGLKSLLRSVKGQTEKSAIAQALEQTNWNRKAAANLLQVSYRTLLYKIELYHMNEPAGYISHTIPASGIKHAKKDERTN